MSNKDDFDIMKTLANIGVDVKMEKPVRKCVNLKCPNCNIMLTEILCLSNPPQHYKYTCNICGYQK